MLETDYSELEIDDNYKLVISKKQLKNLLKFDVMNNIDMFYHLLPNGGL